MAVPIIIADFESALSTAIAVGGTSFSLSSVLDDDGVALPSGTYYFTVDNGSSNKEYFLGQLSGSSVTGVYSVSRQGVETSGAVRAHRVGASVIITDFATYKKYIDGIAIAGAPNAGVATIGITRLSTAPASAADPVAVGDNDTRLPTTGERQAMVGQQGSPSSTNKFLTNDFATDGGTDQSQTTQDSSSVVGEANTTGLRNKLAQSFTPSKTHIRGVKLYKSADTGVFTGTVTIGLFADTAGSPSGSALATATLTNAQWTQKAVGEIEVLFSAEYSSLVAGTLYWIVIQTSTSDTSNHPNFGINTAGSYASGSVKYNNTTDGWIAVSNIDLYFKTLRGTTSQAIISDSAGKISTTFYDTSKMPLPAYVQNLALSDLAGVGDGAAFGSNADGSVFFCHLVEAGLIYRFERDSLTGAYLQTHTVNPAAGLPANDTGAFVVLGIYVYFFINDGTNITCRRFLAADLTGETAMTVPTVGCTEQVSAWTDGVFVYVVSAASATTSRKWSVSGTTFTAVSTTAITAFIGNGVSMMVPAETGLPYSFQPSAVIKKYADINASSSSSTQKRFPFYNTDELPTIILNIDATRMYIGGFYEIQDAAGDVATGIALIPITKP